MQSVLNIALDIIKTLLIIDVMIFVHELGHFIAAKKSGITVLRFAIGFGPKIVGYKKGDTEYCILALPFGGYVKMAGENPAEAIEQEEEIEQNTEGFYTKASVSSRALVAFSGPFMNIVFSVFAIAFAYMIGMPPRLGTEIGFVEPSSPAQKAGIMSGDKVVSIDGYKTRKWDDVREGIAINPEKQLELKVIRNGTEEILYVTPERVNDTEFGKIGVSPPMVPVIGQIKDGSPAELIGFKSGDDILSINGKRISHVIEIVNEIEAVGKKQKTMELTVNRDGNIINLNLPMEFDEIGSLKSLEGMSFGKMVRLNPISAFGAAIPETIETGAKVFQFFKRLIVRDVSAKYVAGPVGIIQITMSVVKTGMAGILWFAGFFSINLGLINLLPIFITDGWVLLMLLIEKVRGQAISLKRQVLIQQVGIVFFIALFLLVTYNDVLRIFTNKL